MRWWAWWIIPSWSSAGTRTGIPYDAIDGVPARLFFCSLAPTVTQHLAILARLSRMLRDPKLRQGLLTAGQPEEVIALIREAEAKL